MSKLSTVSFRANVPNATAAISPVTVILNPMSQNLQKLIIFASSVPDLSKFGFRVRNHGVLILPDNGSNEAGLTLGAGEAGWMPLINSTVEVYLSGYDLAGPPFNLSLDFYNTAGAAVLVGGFVHTSQPETGMTDLIREIRHWSSKVLEARPLVQYDEHITQDKNSTRPAYPTQKVTK